MALLDFPPKELKNHALTVRLRKGTIDKLRSIAERHEVSQADVVERLITAAFEEMGPEPKTSRKQPRRR